MFARNATSLHQIRMSVLGGPSPRYTTPPRRPRVSRVFGIVTVTLALKARGMAPLICAVSAIMSKMLCASSGTPARKAYDQPFWPGALSPTTDASSLVCPLSHVQPPPRHTWTNTKYLLPPPRRPGQLCRHGLSTAPPRARWMPSPTTACLRHHATLRQPGADDDDGESRGSV